MDVRPALLILITNPFTSGNPKRLPLFRFLWGERRKWSHSFLGLPQIRNLWEEEEAQPLHLLQSNLIMDCRFRRSGAVWNIAHMLANARFTAFLLFSPPTDEREMTER